VPIKVRARSSFSACSRPASRQGDPRVTACETRSGSARWTSQSRLEASNFPGVAGEACSFRSLGGGGAGADDDGKRKRRNEKEKRPPKGLPLR
jgi:hypothetical protein